MLSKYDKKLLVECCKIVLSKEADLARENDVITESQFVKLEKKIDSLSDNRVLLLIFKEAKIPEFDSDESKAMKYSAALVGGSMAAKSLKNTKLGKKIGVSELGGAAIASLALFIFRKAMNPCVRQAVTLKGKGLRERRVHVHQCQADAIKKVIVTLVPKLSACAAAKNPSKCHHDIEKVLDHWKQKYHEEILKISKLEVASA